MDVVHPSLNGKAGDTLVFTAQPGDSEWQMSGNKATQTGARFVVPPMMLSDALDEWAAGGVTDFVIAAGREGPPIAAEAPDLAAATAALRSCRDVIGVW